MDAPQTNRSSDTQQPARPLRTASDQARAAVDAGEMRQTESKADRHSRIAERAYARFLARGGEPGDELQDWLEAERELDAEAGSRGGNGSAAGAARPVATPRPGAKPSRPSKRVS